MKFVPTEVADCTVVEVDRHFDHRGFFQELYEEEKYQGVSVWGDLPNPLLDSGLEWKQANWSSSKKNVLRGIHSAPYAKLVTCVSGHIWDLVVDLRNKSPTYLKWIGIELSADSPKQIYVPPGCGHGFVALEDSMVVYLQSGCYAKEGERNVMYNDAVLKIDWPGQDHIISDRDKGGMSMWEYQLCDEDLDFKQNDEFQKIWLASLPIEAQREWRCKFPYDV